MVYRVTSTEWDGRTLWYVEDERGVSIECQDKADARNFATECTRLSNDAPQLSTDEIFTKAMRIRYTH